MRLTLHWAPCRPRRPLPRSPPHPLRRQRGLWTTSSPPCRKPPPPPAPSLRPGASVRARPAVGPMLRPRSGGGAGLRTREPDAAAPRPPAPSHSGRAGPAAERHGSRAASPRNLRSPPPLAAPVPPQAGQRPSPLRSGGGGASAPLGVLPVPPPAARLPVIPGGGGGGERAGGGVRRGPPTLLHRAAEARGLRVHPQAALVPRPSNSAARRTRIPFPPPPPPSSVAPAYTGPSRAFGRWSGAHLLPFFA